LRVRGSDRRNRRLVRDAPLAYEVEPVVWRYMLVSGVYVALYVPEENALR